MLCWLWFSNKLFFSQWLFQPKDSRMKNCLKNKSGNRHTDLSDHFVTKFLVRLRNSCLFMMFPGLDIPTIWKVNMKLSHLFLMIQFIFGTLKQPNSCFNTYVYLLRMKPERLSSWSGRHDHNSIRWLVLEEVIILKEKHQYPNQILAAVNCVPEQMNCKEKKYFLWTNSS